MYNIELGAAGSTGGRREHKRQSSRTEQMKYSGFEINWKMIRVRELRGRKPLWRRIWDHQAPNWMVGTGIGILVTTLIIDWFWRDEIISYFFN